MKSPFSVKTILFLFGLFCGNILQAQKLFPFVENGKFGFKDINDKVLVPAVLTEAEPFSEGKAFVISEGVGGYIRDDLSWVFGDSSVTAGSRMLNGVAVIQRKHRNRKSSDDTEFDFALQDSSGHSLIPFSGFYDNIFRLDDLGIFIARKNTPEIGNVYHLYRRDGTYVPKNFTDIKFGVHSCAVGLGENGKFWVYGKKGQLLLNYRVDQADPSAAGVVIKIGGGYGAINSFGKMLLLPRYADVIISQWQPFASFLNAAGDTSGCMDMQTGRVAFYRKVYLLGQASNNVVIASGPTNDHEVLDLQGKLLGKLSSFEAPAVQNQDAYLYHFVNFHYSDGIVAVRHADGLWYGHDKAGRQLFKTGVPEEFEMSNGLAIIPQRSAYGVINAKGDYIIPPIHTSIVYSRDSSYFIGQGHETSEIYDIAGNTIFSVPKAMIEEYWDNFFSITPYAKYRMSGYYNVKTRKSYYTP